MDGVSTKTLTPQQVQQRIITTQANIQGALEKLESVLVGNPEGRQVADDLREQLTVLWLLYEAAMRQSDDRQR